MSCESTRSLNIHMELPEVGRAEDQAMCMQLLQQMFMHGSFRTDVADVISQYMIDELSTDFTCGFGPGPVLVDMSV